MLNMSKALSLPVMDHPEPSELPQPMSLVGDEVVQILTMCRDWNLFLIIITAPIHSQFI